MHIMHIIGVYCILLIEECATLLLVLYIIYTGQTQFFFSSFLFFSYSNLHIWPLCFKFYLVCNLDIPLQCLVYFVFSFYFIITPYQIL